MKVLMVTPRVDEENSILGFIPTWINCLAKRVDKLDVITLAYNENSRLSENVTVYSLGKKSGKLSKLLYFNSSMLGLIREKPDVIFCHMYPNLAAIATPYGKLFRVPVVWWRTHGNVSLTTRFAHFLADKIATASKESFRTRSNKIIITGHGIDTDRFKPLAKSGRGEKKKNILTAGRISPVKDYETFIRAAGILVNEKGMQDFEFLVVGGVPMASQEAYYERLKQMVGASGLEGHLKFVGPVPYTEVASYYQDCDIFISNSRTGSIDKTVLEAMACQKPALTSNEAYTGVFGDYANDLMFLQGDHLDLAEKINSLLNKDEKQRSNLGVHLRKIVETEHSINHLMDQLIAIFKMCTG